MKKLALATLALTTAASVFAQGTVVFNNRVVGSVVTYVYWNPTVNVQIRGNSATDTPTGTSDWTGFTKISGSGYMAALLSAPGSGNPETQPLSFAVPTTTFRTGGAAGNITGTTATLVNVTPDAASAMLEMFAWDNSSGLYGTALLGWDAWKSGLIAGGTSGAFQVNAIGGVQNGAPTLNALQSFNIYAVPEPATMALAGLGAAALLIFRRRK